MTALVLPERPLLGSAEVILQDDKRSQRDCGTESASCSKVLLVDDSRFSRIAASRIIQQIKGLAVIEARDGDEALEMIRRESPATVVTDLEMPRMNGLELVAEVRASYPEIPVILMTAHGSEHVAIQALRAGATNYVPKSALGTELLHTLKKVLAIASMERRKLCVKGCMQHREACFQVKNDPELIAPLVEMLLEDVSAIESCDSTSRMRVGVALQEALANAMFHGNLELSSDLRQDDERHFYELGRKRQLLPPYCDRRIEVHSSVDRHGATFVISDEGPGFDTSTLIKPIDEEDLLRIGGRGMLLIRAFMDEVQHNESGNRITMTKRHMPGSAP